jgi:hypothetical protein
MDEIPQETKSFSEYTHSVPRVSQDSGQRQVGKPHEDVYAPQSIPTAPPSIFTELNGKTYLAQTLGIKGEEDTTEINGFILEKMRLDHLEDTQENYDKVLDELLSRVGISRGHQKDFLLHKISMYLRSKEISDEDNLVLAIKKK